MKRKSKPRLPIAAVLRLAKAKAHGTKAGKRGYTRKVKHKNKEAHHEDN